MNTQKCKFDDKGQCIHHGAGTQGETDLINKMVDAVQDRVRVGGVPILEVAIMVRDVLLPAYETEAARTRALGGTPTRPIEAEMVAILTPLVQAIKEADEKLSALHMVGPLAS